MMNAVFEQLAEALTYLGKKQIITLQLGSSSLEVSAFNSTKQP